MVPCVHADTGTSAYTYRVYRHRRMHGCIIKLRLERNSLTKSLSREVVTSVALFTRLMPCCTQERVNQARGYTRCPEPASSSIIPSPPRNRNEATPCNGGPHRDEGRPFTGALYTIRVRMTVVSVELKPFVLQ